LLGALVFLFRHLAFSLLVLLVLILVTYFGVNAARGMEAGQAATVAVEDSVQYISRLLRGDLGMTTAGSNSLVAVPVSQVISERLPRSLALMGISLLGATIIGLALGVSAARRGTKRSLGIIIATIIGISVPSFFAAFLLQLAVITLTQKTGRTWLPVGGWGWDSHLLLPVLVLGARPLAQITRVTFVSVRDVLDQDYIRTAYSKGLRRVQIMGRHVMRNAAIPILVTVGVSLSFILGSLPVVELYFGIPGVGFTLLGAIARQDDELAVALLLCLGTLFLLVQFVLDVANRLVDPRSAETPGHLAAAKSRGPIAGFKSLADDIGDYITDNALTHWVKRRMGSETVAVGPSLVKTESQSERAEMAAQPSARRVGWSAAYRNVPLVAGAVLMLVILVVVLFGVYLAPHNPYATQGLEIENGQFSVPPFEPSEQYPWGTDVLGRDLASLILTGAQLTLTLALLVVVARMGIGIILGAIAGWRNGSWLDRLIMGTAEIIAAFPNVLLAMLIILALGIRQGMWPFVVGLGFVGWGDTMRFVRGEVTSIRPRAFIESAIAIGARAPRIVFKHIMPNLFSPLIALFALEMGAVLMLLGELGFLSIFVGGGAFYQLDTFAAPFHYSDVPEWGALLSNIRTYSRSYPWLAIYPIMAFFISILAFNLFGEGIRRLVDDGSIIINRLVNRYTLAMAAIGVVVFIWFRANSGPVAFYRQDAEEFDGQLAEARLADLTEPAFEGRALGSAGLDAAAAYIADQFEAMGLQPAGEQLTYFQERIRSFGKLDALPELTIADGGPEPVYGRDFAAYTGRFIPIGQMNGPVRYIGLGEPLPIRGYSSQRYRALRTADFSDEILLALSVEEAQELQEVPRGGMLVVVSDPALLERNFTLSGRSPQLMNIFTGPEARAEVPSLWITEEIADRLLAGTGKTAAQWRAQDESLEVGQINEVPLDVDVNMIVDGTLEERWPVQNVIGYLPGLAATPGEAQMDNQVIMVLAQYDSPPVGPGGVYEAANDNASGVAVMLEAIRVMQETEYQPNRTFLFVAYSGEGLEGGESVSNPEISRFLQAKGGFATFLEPQAVVHVRGVGGGSGDALEISAGGSLRLVELFENAARKVGADVKRRDDPIDISVIYQEGSPYESGQDAPEVRLTWEGWAEHARLPSDTMDNISVDDLSDAGRTLTLALMIMGRERQY
jgi:ABC-type dipeptide/oligopeptide/nickel transport system permease subunit